MNQIEALRRNLFAKGCMDSQISQIMILLVNEYQSVLETASKVPLLESRVEELEAKLEELARVQTPIEDEAQQDPTPIDNDDNNIADEATGETDKVDEPEQTDKAKAGFSFSK